MGKMSLKVIIHSASNLPDVDLKGKSDPFVVLSFRGREKKTKSKENTVNPIWQQKEAEFEWPLEKVDLSYDEKLSIKIKDYKNVWFKRLLGQVEIPLREALESKKMEKRAFNLVDGKDRPIMDATITLEIEHIQSVGSRDDVDERDSGDHNVADADDDYYDDQDDDGGKQSGRIVGLKRSRRRITRTWSNKTKDFQILIQIIEGRHLPGSGINPRVRVTVAGKRRQTTVAPSTTDSPFYNESLTFDFRHTSEAELFDKTILLEVFNARVPFRSNALLGVYKFDIGFVYERKDHSFIRKWIMLYKPEGTEEKDSTNIFTKSKARFGRSPAGYLKLTAVVQGSGDKLPVGINIPSTGDSDEDIDANSLIPLDVQRQSAFLVLKVYQVNDLPQMDSGVRMKFKSFFASLSLKAQEEAADEGSAADLEKANNLVDPYLTFSFSGKKLSTDIKYNSSNPNFSQVLKIPFRFPSLSDRLTLQLMDWDQGSKDDYISTAFLSLSSISGPGGIKEGFLPMFGPCFINFYGSPREYHQMPDKYEYLNKGIGEGVAYRGRALVELKTELTLGSVARPERRQLEKDDKIHFERFQNRSGFTLFACFHEATMVRVTDAPVEFELSIGNKGTKFDESVAHSNTTPCKAVPDGSHYHYLPWGREKPCIWIDCEWEDISFRIESHNILNRMREFLENDLEEVKRLNDDIDGLEEMQSILTRFSETCRKNLQHFQYVIPSQSGRRNTLDDKIHNLRIAELQNLMKDANQLSNKPQNERRKETVIAEIKNFIKRIRSMTMEPQLSMPDVILWMISGNKRIAYYRMPAHDLMYLNSQHEDACGQFCGKTIELSLKHPGLKEGEDNLKIPALVRMELWLGLAKHQQQWEKHRKNGEFSVYAETYENEMRKGKQWNLSTSRNWPNYSDVAGHLKLSKDSFVAPDGWEFSGKWIEPTEELTTIHYPDENLSEFLDELYEHERRRHPGGDWEPGQPTYVDSNGNEIILPMDPPNGWFVVHGQTQDQKPTAGWSVDLVDRAVDSEGWEYSTHRSYFDYGPEEKAYHLSRRRRLTRLRKREPGKQVQRDPPSTDGWEYARSLQEEFHLEKKSEDCLRRRRLLRKIVPKTTEEEEEGGRPKTTEEASIKFPIFKVDVKGKKGKESVLRVLPRMFISYKQAIKCQLWASIYQARGLIAQDDTGMNDPYVRVTFVNQSKKTKTLPQSLCPTWDQTLIFGEVEIYGDPRENPPSVVMELFDEDKRTHDFLGRCIFKPKVLFDGNKPQTKLVWYKVRRGEQDGGQILARCELFLTESANLPDLPEKKEGYYCVPDRLRPKTKEKAIEILSWGVRHMKDIKPLFSPKPSVEFECNQTLLKSDEIISDMKKCPNFSSPLLERKLLKLPINDEYAPPLIIRVYDNTMFGKTLIGLHEVQSLKDEVDGQSQEFIDDDEGKTKREKGKGKGKGKGPARSKEKVQEFEDEGEFDWWSKYYASQAQDQQAKTTTVKGTIGALFVADEEKTMTHTEKYLAAGYDTLAIYPGKLEDVPQFKGFNDFITTFPLRKGKTKSVGDDDTYVGEFKYFMSEKFEWTGHRSSKATSNFKKRSSQEIRGWLIGICQGAIRIFDDPNSFENSLTRMCLPSQEPIDCIVRVYVIRATQLQPKDWNGLANPYLSVSLGKTKKGQPGEHIPDTLNPVFGRMFDFKAKIPLVKYLKIRVMDYDSLDPDDLIGETKIDLEQRLLSRYHATCGLPKTYFKSGPFKWRDTLTPFQLLAKHCAQTGKELRLQRGKPDVINVGNVPYFIESEPATNKDVGEPLECLALRLLRDTFEFVPEHVETRPLYSKVRPDIEQGKLEMWVDIFTDEDEKTTKHDPSTIGTNVTDGKQLLTIVEKVIDKGKQETEKGKKCSVDQLLQEPLQITPHHPIKYELRVIIWNTTDVLLNDRSITNEKMSDIFVKASLKDMEKDQQRTSVHGRSLDGNGSFNWRMVFPFEYLPIEKKIVIKKKVHYVGRKVKEETKPPLLKVEIFDKDTFSGNDLLGDLELNLTKLIRPCEHPSHCGTMKDPKKIADENPTRKDLYLDLFKKQSNHGNWTTGWWACYGKEEIGDEKKITASSESSTSLSSRSCWTCCLKEETDEREEKITGKVEMTLEILDEEQAKAKPVGRGQSEPNQYPTLQKPIRPAYSFLWYMSPLKTFRYIIWRNYKGHLIKLLVFSLLVLLIFLFVYSVPNYVAKRVVGA